MSNHNEIKQSRRGGAGGVALSVLLWTTLVVSGAVNAAGSLAGISYSMRMWAGGLTLLCITLLIVSYVGRRSR
ncbi:hypothetical protein F0L68_00760 [Solihabitans fulvus]|uniref:Uncharacterized protein n=1 Tax=Solihabitans fulvus TaxID=1892852 RepID=A0A5B2XUB9_9PSEU|nr:hypothetical protein [Solihabitans fulvus]KAA2267096.1 hypothetical protein F0L68_00760 [Solihabitans fulvus]